VHKSYLADKGFLLLLSANFFMKKAIPYLTNKYLIAAILFIVWMLFYDQRDYFQQKERRDELKKLELKKAYYEQEIEKTKKELNDLQHNPAAIEKYARERYLMKKDGEDIFIIEDSTARKK
jgi:cell division protein FtsB